jgi:hypothetical protein
LLETRQYLADYEMAVQGTSQLDPSIAVVNELAAIFDRCFETLQAVGAETARLRYLE